MLPRELIRVRFFALKIKIYSLRYALSVVCVDRVESVRYISIFVKVDRTRKPLVVNVVVDRGFVGKRRGAGSVTVSLCSTSRDLLDFGNINGRVVASGA